jgi:ABC-2 type transport system ATP-binding protein
MAETEVALETVRLGKRYGRRWALSDCSLTLPTGRMAALVGPNGAGKTTLLHLAAGLLQPNSGSVHIFGRDPWMETQATLPQIGFVAQDHPLYRGFSVADTLEFGRRMNRNWDNAMPKARLGKLGIPLEQQVGKLSGGQQAQVALALALGKRPNLLLLDEPIASLDPLARRDFLRTLVEAAHEQGITTLLSSHIIADLEQACDYLIILSAAHVQLTGAITDIMRTHRLLTGPANDAVGVATIRARWEVIGGNHTLRQVTLVARVLEMTDDASGLPDGWRAEEAPLEEVVLAYLGRPEARNVAGAPANETLNETLEVAR